MSKFRLFVDFCKGVGLNQFYSDVVHVCEKHKDERGMVSYQIMGLTYCPGCGETQPDDIQTIWALHNMDKPTPIRMWGNGPMTAVKSSRMIKK